MKILLIIPPTLPPISPYLSVPLLAGQLSANGFDVENLDLSIEFFDWVLNKDFLLNQYEKAKDIFKTLSLQLEGKSIQDKFFKGYTNDTKKSLYKKYVIENILQKEEENYEIINNISSYIDSYKDAAKFYNLKKSKNIDKKINKAFNIAMLPYAPSLLRFNLYKNPLYKNNYNSIKIQSFDNENNIFYPFFKEKIREHKINLYDLILISVPNEAMLLPSFTLMRLIKENSKAKIAVGGNIITRIDNELLKIPDAFNYFYDYLMIGCGEVSVVELAKYIETKTSDNEKLKKIDGLIYMNKGKLTYNKPNLKYDINKSHNMSLKGINLSKYYTPEIIMPIQMTKGCYWGKCEFCGLHYPPKKYSVKDVVKVVDEIEFLNKKHNIKIFEFVDESIHPKYLSKLADEILKRNLDIKYCLLARLDNGFTKELCEKLYLSGLKLIEIGYETASKRIFDKLNKGIDYSNRLKIIKMFADAGIFTYVYAIIGYPSETKEEALATINIAEKYKDIVDFMFIHKFWLDKKAPIYKHYQEMGISKIEENKKDVFSQGCNYYSDKSMDAKECKEIYNQYLVKNRKIFNSHLCPDEYMFLYVMHYGREKFKKLIAD